MKSREENYMALSLSFHGHMSGQPDVRPSMPMPIVYENIPVTPTLWEYRVLTIDMREEGLPDAALLNELGGEGWLLVGILEQKAAEGRSTAFETRMTLSEGGMLEQKAADSRRTHVHYYFVRQKME